jgi:hypothetical protein
LSPGTTVRSIGLVILTIVLILVASTCARPSPDPVDGRVAEGLVSDFLDKFFSERWREAQRLVFPATWEGAMDDHRVLYVEQHMQPTGQPHWNGSYVEVQMYGESDAGLRTYTGMLRFDIGASSEGGLLITDWGFTSFDFELGCTHGNNTPVPCPSSVTPSPAAV